MNGRIIFMNLASIASIIALLLCVIVPVLVFTGDMTKDAYHVWFNWASLAWFIFAPFWFVPGIFGESWEKAGNRVLLRPHKED